MWKKILKQFKSTPSRFGKVSLLRYLSGELFNLEARIINVIDKQNTLVGLPPEGAELLYKMQKAKSKQSFGGRSITYMDLMNYCNKRFKVINQLIDEMDLRVAKMDSEETNKPPVELPQAKPIYPKSE